MASILSIVTARFEGPRAKVRRAKEHFKELEGKLGPNSADKAYSLLTEKHGESGEYLVEITVHPWHEAEWSVIVGEIAHDLHSALDHIVCELIRINNPASSCSDSSFPIYKDPLGAGEQREELRGVPDPARAIIEAHQPHTYVRGAPTLHPLWQLRVLSNRDKHRELAFFGGLTISEYDAGPAGEPHWGISAWHLPDMQPVIYTYPDRTRSFRYVVPPPEMSVEVRPPSVYIVFEEPPEMRSRDVLLVIWEMIAELDRVISKLSAAFP